MLHESMDNEKFVPVRNSQEIGDREKVSLEVGAHVDLVFGKGAFWQEREHTFRIIYQGQGWDGQSSPTMFKIVGDPYRPFYGYSYDIAVPLKGQHEPTRPMLGTFVIHTARFTVKQFQDRIELHRLDY